MRSEHEVSDPAHEAQYRTDPGVKKTLVSRRAVLGGVGAIGASLVSGLTIAADSETHDHAHHAPKNPALLDASDSCASSAQRCLAHCLVAFQEGDTTLADCARKVHEMLPICEAFGIQVASNSPYVPALSKVCRQACADCEKVCRKHEDEHVECKNCAEACAQLVAAIDGI